LWDTTLGQFFSRLGTRVTIVEPSERILPNYEPELGATLREILEQEGITILTSSKAAAVNKDGEGISVEVVGDAATTLRSSHLLVATGRVPTLKSSGWMLPEFVQTSRAQSSSTKN